MAEEAPPAKRLARAGSFSGVWWKLGDAGDPSAVERRLRVIADEEADLKARIRNRQAAARGVRRGVALASLTLEAASFVYTYWTSRRRRGRRVEKKKKVLLLPLLAVPALSTVVLAALARFQKKLDARDDKELERLGAEKKANIRGSHHNMQMLIQKYDPDGANDSSSRRQEAAKLKRTHSRLSFHIGDE